MAHVTNGTELDVTSKYQQEGGSRRAHVGGQFPHYKHSNGACMCTDRCCLGPGGCLCRGCSGQGHEGCPGALRLARIAAAEMKESQ